MRAVHEPPLQVFRSDFECYLLKFPSINLNPDNRNEE